MAHCFGVLATRYVGLLISSVLGNSYLLLGDITQIYPTLHENILFIKIVLAVALLSLAALNKFKLLPLLVSRQAHAVSRLNGLVLFEIAIALIILTASSLLTTSMTLLMRVSNN